MRDLPKFSDLVVQEVSDHGKATADLLKRLGRGEDVDLVEEASQRLTHLTRTAARFLLFWDNIATLMAEVPGGPLTFPEPPRCAEGEIQTFELPFESVGPQAVQSGLRRRGGDDRSVGEERLTLTPGSGGATIVVDCSRLLRGMYEGMLQVVDASGKETIQRYNVYIDPGAQAK